MSKVRIESEVLLSNGQVLDSDAVFEVPVLLHRRVTRRQLIDDLRTHIEAELPEGVSTVSISVLRENAPEVS